MKIEVASYNIQYGVGQDGRYDLDRTIEAVKDKDIVCLQEVTTNWRVCNRDHQPEILATGLNRFTALCSGLRSGWQPPQFRWIDYEFAAWFRKHGSVALADHLFTGSLIAAAANGHSARVSP